MGVCRCTSKISLCTLSAILWVGAAVLIVIGVGMYSEFNDYSMITGSHHIIAPVAVLLAVGIFLFLLGVVGCVGAFKEQKCLLGMFATILLVIFVGTVLSACLAFFYRGAIDEKMTEGLHFGLDHYTDNYDVQGEVDTMQQKMSCCGVESYEDWENTTWYREHEKTNKTTLYPESCCEGGVCDYPMVPGGNDSALFNQSCHEVMTDKFINHLGIVAYVAGVFAIIQLLGMISSCALIFRRRGEIPYIGFSNPDGMRV